jgi:hypothetical protein
MATIGKNRENALILAIVGVLLIVVTLGLREIANQSPSFADYEAGNPGENVTIVVEDGASGEMIARNLCNRGFSGDQNRSRQLSHRYSNFGVRGA